MIKLSRNNLQEFCRTCLSSLQKRRGNEWEDDPCNSFGSNMDSENDNQSLHKRYDLNLLPQLRKIFVLFTSLDVSKDNDEDLYPRSLCQLCYDKMIDFQEFRNLAINSAEVLYKIVNNLHDDKIEDAKMPKQAGSDNKKFEKEISIMECSYQSNDDDDDKLLLPELAPLFEKSIKTEPHDYNKVSDTCSELLLPNDDCEDNFPKAFVKNEIDSEYADDDSQFYESNALGTSYDSISDDTDDEELMLRNGAMNNSSFPVKMENADFKQRPFGVSKRKRDRNKKTLKCPLCDKQAYKQVYLDAHIRGVHEGHEKPFLCEECQKCFTRYDQLHTHIQSKHVEEQKFICGLNGCDASFKLSKTLETHRQVVHTYAREVVKHGQAARLAPLQNMILVAQELNTTNLLQNENYLVESNQERELSTAHFLETENSSTEPNQGREEENIEQGQELTVAENSEDVQRLGKKRQRNPNNWKKNESKKARQAGQTYINVSGKIKEARTLKEECAANCRWKCRSRLNEETRKTLFSEFWSITSHEQKWEYLTKRVPCQPVKTQTTSWDSRRKESRNYSFRVDGKNIKVCKTMFLNTLDINDAWVRTALQKQGSSSALQPDSRGKNGKSRLKSQLVSSVKEHISAFPKVPSHYCRKDSNREYLDENLDIRKLYRFYVTWMAENYPTQSTIATERQYRDIFNNDFNLHFFKPKKDQCDLCLTWDHSTPEEKTKNQEDHDKHINAKNLARTSSSFGFEQMVELHQSQLNTENKSELWICQLCLKNYSSKRALYEHQRRHSEVRSHICNVCGIGKVTSRELQIHMRTHTPNLEKFKCHLCPQEFNHKNAISRHVRVVHEGQRRFACNYCPKRFGTRNSQVCHERLHTGERPYSCKICHKTYPQIEGLKSHMKSHDKNLRKHICSICSQRFITKKNLIDHERRHQGDKPHICNVCSRGFFSVVDLDAHKQSHTAEEIRAEMTRSSFEAYQHHARDNSYEAQDIKQEREQSNNGNSNEALLGCSSSMSSN